MDIEHQLLFAVLAVQLDLIDPAQLADACAGWATRRDRPLVDLLLERGWLSDEDRTEVDRLLERRLSRHGGDAQAALRSTERDPLLARVEADVRLSIDGSTEAPADQRSTVDIDALPPRFALQSVHAQGGLGLVWRARDRDLNREVALKRIKPPRTADPEARRRFVREAQVTGQLEHPGIVPVYELGRFPATGEPYYAMKLVRGRTLREAIASFHRRAADERPDPIERRRLLAALLDVGNAVAYAHARGVLHRDLKPENVVLGDFGEVVLLDWGLAQLKGAAPDAPGRVELAAEALGPGTTAGKILGSVAYMAPEQARADTDAIDERTDVYGLGAILFELLTGQPPHTGAPQDELLTRIATGPSPRPRDIQPDIPDSLDSLSARALAHNPVDRFPTAAALVAELEAWLADEPVLTYRAIVAAFARLVETHPSSVTYLDQLARSRLTLGLVLDGIGRPAQAEAAFREAIADYERLNAMPGAQPHHRADLATARSHLARVLNAQGRPVKAARMRKAAIADYEHYARLHPPAEDETDGIVDVYLTLTEPLAAPGAAPDTPATTSESAPITHPNAESRAAGETDEPVTQHMAGLRKPRSEAEELLQVRLSVLQPIGRGGMSQVLAAYDNELKRDVVIKQLLRSQLNDERSLQRFLREAQITAQLEHPGIVPVYGLGHRAGTGEPYLLMRRLKGRSLQTAIAEFHKHGPADATKAPSKALLAAFVKACETIAYAHSRGVIHRDIKPSNIMLGEYGDVVVLDWALAIQTEPTDRPIDIFEEVNESRTFAGTIVGTPAFMSPEQARGVATTDPSLDVYALGATLFTILTGTHPFKSQDIRELLRAIVSAPSPPRARDLNHLVPPVLDAISCRAMARIPADRYPTASALGHDVQAWLTGDRASVAGESWFQRVTRRLRHPAALTSPASRSG